MKHALCETSLGWVAIGIEDGAIVAAALPASKQAAQRTIQDWGAIEPAPAAEARPLIDLIRRAAEGADVRPNGQVRIVGGTKFQRAVWQALLEIPHGGTVSYVEIARRVGHPAAARAVGQAVGSNPIPLLLPCHRVLASDGTLGGFGGGLPMKKKLLTLEGVAV